MLPIEEQTDQVEETRAAGGLLTGDLGVVVLRSLLENGVGYVVSSWQDRPTPIDAAIDDARERVLAPRGVVLRRLRSLSALEPIVRSPEGGVVTSGVARGAVVFAGRRGLRPALEQFVRIEAAGAVVGFTFDLDALRIEDAIVVDPEPTAIGLRRAIDRAVEASVAAGRPALVVLRERTLGMRGTIRERAELSPIDAAASDAADRAERERCSVADAVELVGLVQAQRGVVERPAARVLVVGGPLRHAAERALATLAGSLAPTSGAGLVDPISLVTTATVGVLPAPSGAARELLSAASAVAVIGSRADRVAERLTASGVGATVHATSLDPGVVRGEQVVAAVASWLLDAASAELADDARAVLEPLAAGTPGRSIERAAAGRVPRRSEQLHRGVSPTLAAGLALAQGVIGVPGRIDAAYPTYQADTGVPLSIVPAELFAAHGAASAAPGTGPGVFVVTGSAGGVMEAAGAAGASIEHVDGGSARAIGQAIARACRVPRTAPHVIAVTEVQRVAGPRTAHFGMDPELAGTERLATSVVPTAATALVELGDELVAGPSVLVLDHPDAHAALGQLRELSPATWDLHRLPQSTSRIARTRWTMRRRIVRAAAGVDL